MSFPDHFESCEPMPWGMVRVETEQREMPSAVDRYFAHHRFRHVGPRHIMDEA